MWNIIDDNTTKLILKRLKNRVNKIAYIGDSTKIYIVGNDMELKKSKTSLKDSLINIINQRFDSMTKESNQRFDEKFDLITEKFNARFDLITKEIKDVNKQTNEKFDLITEEIKEVKKDINNLDTKLNNVIELNNLKV